MLNSPVTPGKQDKDARQRALIDAATLTFAEKGYDVATTREIAERARCSEGLIHRYFGSKHGLLMAILREKAANVRDVVQVSVDESDDLGAEIEALVMWSLDFMWEQRDFMRVVTGRALVDPEVGRFVGNTLNARRVQVFAERIERHRAAGRVRDDVDIETAAQALAGISYQAGFFLQVVFEMDRRNAARIAREAARAITIMIAAPQVKRTERLR